MSVYDLVGNLTGSTDRRGKTSTFEFDKLNRNYRATTPGSAAGSTVNSYTLYDRVGHLPVGRTGFMRLLMSDRTGVPTRRVGYPRGWCGYDRCCTSAPNA